MKSTLRNKLFQCEYSYHWGRVMSVSTTVPGGGLVGFLPLINNLALILFLTMMTVNLGLKKKKNMECRFRFKCLLIVKTAYQKPKPVILKMKKVFSKVFAVRPCNILYFLMDSVGLLTWGMIGALKRPLSICQSRWKKIYNALPVICWLC